MVETLSWAWEDIDGFEQERRNSSVLAMELRLSCTILSIWESFFFLQQKYQILSDISNDLTLQPSNSTLNTVAFYNFHCENTNDDNH